MNRSRRRHHLQIVPAFTVSPSVTPLRPVGDLERSRAKKGTLERFEDRAASPAFHVGRIACVCRFLQRAEPTPPRYTGGVRIPDGLYSL